MAGDPRSDLVSIDDAGSLRAIGKAATTRLRALKGMWRLLPGPMNVLLLRHQPDDPAAAKPAVRFAAEITGAGAVCDVFTHVARSRWRGELLVVGQTSLDRLETRAIFFDEGTVVAARSDAIGERLGEVMYKLGGLTAQQVQAVMARMPFDTKRRFGETALDLGFVTRDQLFHFAGRQTEEIVFNALRVAVGAVYFFDAPHGLDEARIGARVHLPADVLLAECIARIDQIDFFRARIPSNEHVPARVEGRTEPPPEAMEPNQVGAVWRAIDGKKSIAELGRATTKTALDVTRAVFQLVQAGLVDVQPPTATSAESIVVVFNDAMRAIHEAAGKYGRDRDLAEHLATYRSSAGVLDGVFDGAGPKADGTVEPVRVAQNVRTIAGVDPLGALADWLHEYVAFALFDVGADMPKNEHTSLSRQVRARLQQLVPPTKQSIHPSIRPRPVAARGGKPPGPPPRAFKETQREVKPPTVTIAAAHSPSPTPARTVASAPFDMERGWSEPPPSSEEIKPRFISSPPPLPAIGAPPPLPDVARLDASRPLPLSDRPPAATPDAMELADAAAPTPPPRPSQAPPAIVVGANDAPVLEVSEAPADFDPFPAREPSPVAPIEGAHETPRKKGKSALWALAVALFVVTALCAFALVRHLTAEPTIAAPTVASPHAEANVSKPTASSSVASTNASASTIVAPIVVSASAKVAPSASASIAPSASASASASASSAPSTIAVPSVVVAAVDTNIPSTMTALSTTPAGAGHRVYVDDRVVGEGPGPIQVACGTHSVKVGSAGTPKDISLPCGESMTVAP